VAIFDQAGGRVFLGMPVLPIAEHASIEYDLMIVAALDSSGQQSVDLLNIGVPREKLFPLRKAPEPAPKSASAKASADKRARTPTVRSRSTNGKHS